MIKRQVKSIKVVIVAIEIIFSNNFHVQNKLFILIVWCDKAFCSLRNRKI